MTTSFTAHFAPLFAGIPIGEEREFVLEIDENGEIQAPDPILASEELQELSVGLNLKIAGPLQCHREGKILRYRFRAMLEAA